MGIEVRPIRPADVPAVVTMVHELAEFERAPDECHLTVAQLNAALFTDKASLFGHVAFDDRPRGDRSGHSSLQPIGCALWFLNFSTWHGVHGVYLEDLYVRPDARGVGAGRALLATLAELCVRRGYFRMDWWVLHWNPARDFYHAIGAVAMDEWMPYRLTGPGLAALAATASTPGIQAVESLQGDTG
jgi:GNAT superfamily N-acetyltransferase